MTQNARVLAFIRSHPGCTTGDLQFGLQPRVVNVTARVSDLRDRGYEFEDTPGHYTLVSRKPAQLSIDGSERLLA